MSTPFISVVMSVYNEPIEWLRLAIDSILCQTYRDFEFIVVNDNPSRMENTILLRDYSLSDNRVVVVTNSENIGLTKSLNKGISLAKGQFIARMDADDISLPNRFEKQVDVLQEGNCDLCSSICEVIDEAGNSLGVPSSLYNKTIFDLFLENHIVHPSVMFRRELLDLRTPFYNESCHRSQDYELWAFLFLQSCSFCTIKDVLLKYRKSANQISNRSKSEQYTNFNTKRVWFIDSYLKRTGIFLTTENHKEIIDKLMESYHSFSQTQRECLGRILYLLMINNGTCGQLLRYTIAGKKFCGADSKSVLRLWFSFLHIKEYPSLRI